MSTTITTKKVRLSYAHVFEPVLAPGADTAKYSTCVLVDKKDKETLSRIKQACEEAKKNGISSVWNGKLPNGLHMPLRDGDEERPDDPNYAGKYFFNCSSKRKPGVVDSNLNAILDPEEVYSGCYARVNVNFYPYNSNGNRGVAAGLNHVQKLADGERFGNVITAEAAFADEADDDVDDLLS